MEIPMTIINGAHAVKGFKGDITFIDRRIAITRK
jgi:hypothetical protein